MEINIDQTLEENPFTAGLEGTSPGDGEGSALQGDPQEGQPEGGVGDDETELGGEDEDGQGEEGADEEGVDITEQVFALPITSEDGTEKEEQITGRDLPMLVSKGKAYDNLSRHYQELYAEVQRVAPIVNLVNRDPFVQNVAYLRSQGVPEAQILAQLQMQFAQPGQDPAADEFADLDPTTRKALESHIAKLNAPLEDTRKKLDAYEQQQRRSQVMSHNNSMLMQAVQTGGYEMSNDPSYTAKVTNAIKSLYPGVDATMIAFTPEQARAIIREAGLPAKRDPNAKGKQAAAAVRKASNAPRIISGKQPQGSRPGGEQAEKKKTVSRRDAWRLANM